MTASSSANESLARPTPGPRATMPVVMTTGRTTANTSPVTRRAGGRPPTVDSSGSAPSGIPTSSVTQPSLRNPCARTELPCNTYANTALASRGAQSTLHGQTRARRPSTAQREPRGDAAAEAHRPPHLRVRPPVVRRVRHRGDPQGPHPRRTGVPLPDAVDRRCRRRPPDHGGHLVPAGRHGLPERWWVVRGGARQPRPRGRHGRGRIADGRLRHDCRRVRRGGHRQRHLRSARPQRAEGHHRSRRHRGADPHEPPRYARVGSGVRRTDLRVRHLHPRRQRRRPDPGGPRGRTCG